MKNYLILCIILFASQNRLSADNKNEGSDQFNKGWTLFSSEYVNDAALVSSSEFKAEKYYRTDIPKTVLAALVENGAYSDIYYGENIRNIPEGPFQKSWWYRKEFIIDEIDDVNYQLTLEGVNYKAELWLNGKKIADKNKIEGAFGRFSFNITDILKKGNNIIAIEVIPPQHGDLTLGFVDWNPAPPDKNMGLWRGVVLKKTGIVSLDEVFVKTSINDDYTSAELTITGKLTNFSNNEKTTRLNGHLSDGRSFSKTFTIQAGSELQFTISPKDDKALVIAAPRLWWPNNLGEPFLYTLELKTDIDSKTSDEQKIRFGIREVEDYYNEKGYRGYKINGKKIVIKGAGWVDDMLLNDSDEKVAAQVKYAKHMNLNTIRLEGFWGKNSTLYDAADENGILIMLGWSCQWEWKSLCGRKETKHMCIDTPRDADIQTSAYNDQVKWLRNHPSIFLWVSGSDKYPAPDVQSKLNAYFAESDPTRPTLISCQNVKVPASENADGIYKNSGVKMYGPYNYEPPVYWFADTAYGGAYGFNTETGPGPQVPPIESLKKMLPAENLWPVDSVWNFHCGRNEFDDLDVFIKALNNRYGDASSAEEFAMKSQVSNYEAIRPMFEAFGVNKYNATGVIQWMFNSAWPEMYWQLFDYYLMPNGAFYGTKKACQPLNLVYNYKDKNIYLVNDYNQTFNGLKADVKVYNTNSELVYENSGDVSVEENVSRKILDLPKLNHDSGLYFISLELKDSKGDPVSDNFYWISEKDDSLDFANSKWFYTPMKSYADLKSLNTLSKASITYTEKYSDEKDNRKAEVVVKNNSDNIAFFIELMIVDEKTGESVLPVFWSDNYISLLPHSEKILTAEFKTPSEKKVKLQMNGMNIKKDF